MFAVPTGIISSGFVEESEKEKREQKKAGRGKDTGSRENLQAELEKLKAHISRIEDMLED